MEFLPTEKGVPIRFPSEAYLNIDSTDRFNQSGTGAPGESSNKFQINRQLNVLNGYFTRLTVQEVVLDWCIDNISTIWENNTIGFDVSGAPANPYVATIPVGKYTVQELLDELIIQMNAVAPAGSQFLLSTAPSGCKSIDISGAEPFQWVDGYNLQAQLGLPVNDYGVGFEVCCPRLQPITYLDFASPPLTYNQEVYDSTTNVVERNLLYRWWFAWSEEPSYDGYGYPILMGYKHFAQRRALPFPKHIRWQGNQPIGTLNFEVYDSTGKLAPTSYAGNGEFEWGMTLLASEV